MTTNKSELVREWFVHFGDRLSMLSGDRFSHLPRSIIAFNVGAESHYFLDFRSNEVDSPVTQQGEAAATPVRKVPVFVAQGEGKRRRMSRLTQRTEEFLSRKDEPSCTFTFSSADKFFDVMSGKVKGIAKMRAVKMTGNMTDAMAFANLMEEMKMAEDTRYLLEEFSANSFSVGNEPSLRTSLSESSIRISADNRVIEWADDRDHPCCCDESCQAEFGLLKRRHHCRFCGLIFCNDCASKRHKGKRICKSCATTELEDCVLGQVGQELGRKVDLAKAEEMSQSDCAPTPHRLSIDPSSSPAWLPSADTIPSPLTAGMLTSEASIQVSLWDNHNDENGDFGSVTNDENGVEALEDIVNLVSLGRSREYKSEGPNSILSAIFTTIVGAVIAFAGATLAVLGHTLATADAQVGSEAPLSSLLLTSGSAAASHLTTSVGESWRRMEDFITSAPPFVLGSVCSGAVGLTIIATISFSPYFLLFRRRLLVYRLGFQIIAGYRYLQWKTKNMDEDESNKFWNSAHGRYAKAFFDFTVNKGGFWIKFGQYGSSRADILPPEYIETLSKLQDSVPAKSLDDVLVVLQNELSEPIYKVFRKFDSTPLATASIAQVHRAVLRDGRKVVVKVRHRHIDSVMKQDMANLSILLSWVAWINKDFDFRPIVDEWSKECTNELNFLTEAKNTEEVRLNMTAAKQEIRIPLVVTELSTEAILVLEFIDGCKVTDLDALDERGVDRERIFKQICEAWSHQMYHDGVFNGDPHPGNILIEGSGSRARPVLLDFGLTKRLPVDLKIAFAQMVYSARQHDVMGLLGSFEDMGLKLNRENPAQDMENIRFLFRETAPAKEARENAMAYRDKQKELRNPVDAWPGDILFLLRVTFLLQGLASRLGVRVHYLDLMCTGAEKMLKDRRSEEHLKDVIYPEPAALSPLDTSLRKCIRRLYESGTVLGMQVCVYLDGVVIANCAGGVMGTVDLRPVTPSSLFCCMSVTKAVTATALHMLKSTQDNFDYDDKVSKHWPQFAGQGKENTTIKHFLTHQAGLQRAMPDEISLSKLCDWDEMVHAMEDATPATRPGEKTVYHSLTFGWLVGGLSEKLCADGLSISEFVHEKIVKPLKLEGQFFMGAVPADVEDRLAVLDSNFPTTVEGISVMVDMAVRVGQMSEEEGKALIASAKKQPYILDPRLFNSKAVRKAVLPAANGHFTAQALAKFYNALVDDLKGERARLVSKSVLTEAIKPQPSLPEDLPFQFGLGYHMYHVDGEPSERGSVDPANLDRVAFGHAGMGGSLGLCDPKVGLSVGITVNRLLVDKAATNRVIDLIYSHLEIGTIHFSDG